MTKTIQSTIAFTDPQNNALANGLLVLDLNQPCEVVRGGGQVAPMRVAIVLNASGQIPASTIIYANDELSPSGTAYRAKLYNSNMSLVADFGFWSIAGGSPIDLSQEVATSLNVAYPSPVVLNPTATQNITGGFALQLAGVNVVTRTSTDTLTNKTLTAPTITSPSTTGTDSGTETLTNKTLTSPVLNGTPTGTGIPTLTLKKGTGGGNYSSASTTYVRVDSTNLAYAVTIPTGWKLGIQASGAAGTLTAAVSFSVAIADGTSDNSGILMETSSTSVGATALVPFSLSWVVNGDGASHTINLQYKTSNASDSVFMGNSSATLLPVMVFTLSPSN